ncbi:hypothetical protein K501DRAFT_282321 [Backusella circina FSU 941]|nr:hypothetical protein K501DRAFT_282321 [Backusella circina FSU 941]
MSQLDKACKEARRTIDKGGQVTTDPWLCNLYVLRQLKKEVDEENRLRCLMVPIQQQLADFEKRLLTAVKQALHNCLEKPGSLPSEQINDIRDCLDKLDEKSEWESFIETNQKQIVNEQSPTRDYLHINYNNKSNPLVLTLYKGELERRTGVLGKHLTKYYILTQSGFLHQFKMNEKVSPEFSIYVPKTIIIPSTDISNLALGDLKEVPVPKEGFTFEIQRPGSVLQRDKSYVFRTFNLESLIVWCSLLSDVASQNPHPRALQHSTSTLQTILSATSQIDVQSQQATPPPSPMKTYHPQLGVNFNNSSPRSSVYNESNMDSPISPKNV